ncbi:ribosomal protein S18 acetylase RimI-like enzyme [Micromonospora pisi]|uniref:Ribosomal protein S18 acetylase RimI-like enzyme n=1 Tax=Micromonospora pisi TaxID=589240 RepID=A0A495JH83_9ACTN|nr:GNAT family N-acetyltransferase [Micromonospora pisi]RKR88243.1 ribosomal protein S18 acetylase RimI-like enzyme [Micromonospora pisi]
MSGPLVRPAVPAEFPAIARLTVAAYEAGGQLHSAGGYADTLKDVAGRASAGELLVAVDPATGDVVGSVVFVLPGTRFAEISRDGEAEFRMLAVDPTAQGRGVGEALARACVDRAAELGLGAVAICVRDFVENAQRLYARLGFVRTPERDWSPGPGIRLLALRLDLVTAPSVVPAAS